MTKPLKISGTGCSLVDYLYNNISFNSADFSAYRSLNDGDGGLTPGQLVFAEEFEKFAGQSYEAAIKKITKGRSPDKINIGGPGIVALIHAAQMLDNTDCQVSFYGGRGDDESGDYLQSSLLNTPVDLRNYRIVNGATPTTDVLSDPDYHDGMGERVFINTIGAAGNYLPEYLDEHFYRSDVVVFGGTALVPVVHDNLTEILSKAKAKGCITVVNTVYDFRNQKANPGEKWPLGRSDESYRNIDLLITNHEEALRLSGTTKSSEALEFFRTLGTKALIITNGAKNILMYASRNSIFEEIRPVELPVSKAIAEELMKGSSGDTTGCGDNFAGGAVASLVIQLQNHIKKLSLRETVSRAVVAGGYSCFYIGGTYIQKEPGEKRKLIQPYYEAYLKQLNGT